ncbi:MAG: P-loop NTPase fold protein [Chloroflexi bacterium]|nr:P-loop NTPase fold protein [Chloroflexota bacterium]
MIYGLSKSDKIMGFRVQPVPLEVNPGQPFEHDRLDREETAKVLSNLIGSIEGPCVLAIDAKWGMGKTTFLRMWEMALKERGFRVVMFNAWETDFANEPFLALSEELRGTLEEHSGDDNQDAIAKLQTTAHKVLQTAGPAVIRSVASHLLGNAGGTIVADTLAALTDKSVSQYGEAKEAIKEFRKALGEAAITLTEGSEKGAPLMVIIDELDRCRPSYAVELLEVLKHLYSVDGVVFVLALNREELAHSVCALYGTEFDATGYLRRFIDIDVRLPDAGREALIDTHLAALQSQIESIHDVGAAKARRIHGITRDWLVRFFGNSRLDLRALEQALRRLGLMLAMLRGDYDALIKTASFVLIWRTLEPDLYYRFLRGSATDEDIADALFGYTEQGYRASSEGQLLETEIIVAAVEDGLAHARNGALAESRLFDRYRELVDGLDPQAGMTPEQEHAATIMRWVQNENRDRMLRGGPRRFRGTVDRLEMLSGNLRHDLSAPATS